MKKIHCLNPIAACGTDLFPADYEMTDNKAEADAFLVRSASMHEMELPEGLLAVGRAGAGVNNIPLDECAKAGVVVFNTPGANANGVKELVLAGMFLASRDIVGGIKWCQDNAEDENIAKTTEKSKKAFAGWELKGKKLGVILEPSAQKWQTQLPIWEWKFTATTHISPSTQHGDFQEM